MAVPGWKTAATPESLSASIILIGNDSAHQHQDIVHLVPLEQVHDAGDDRIVRAREYRESDDVYIFLQRCADDHFRGLPQSGVNHFHAGIAQGTRNYLGAAIVTGRGRASPPGRES